MDYLDIGRCFSILHRRSQLFIVMACERLQLTYSEYVLLIRLYEREGLSQEELSSMLLLDKAVVTRTMGMLEQKGLIRREKDRKDKRVKRVYLTELAMEQKEYLMGVLQVWIDYLSEGLDQGEIRALVQGFHDIARRATEANVQALTRDFAEKYRL